MEDNTGTCACKLGCADSGELCETENGHQRAGFTLAMSAIQKMAAAAKAAVWVPSMAKEWNE